MVFRLMKYNFMDITAVTSIGGKGTRIDSYSRGLPKGLLDINGKS